MSQYFIKAQESARKALGEHQAALDLALGVIDTNSQAAVNAAPDKLKPTMQILSLRIAAIAKRAAKGENVEQELKILREQAKSIHYGSPSKK